MNPDDARQFVQQWEADWNSRDIERILARYSDDVVFESPHVVDWFAEPTGEIRGKHALREYWLSGLARRPELHFSVLEVRLSVGTIVIDYANERGVRVAEILKLKKGLVVWGCGCYPLPAA
jgi:ketosteroid isomerase-like protein